MPRLTELLHGLRRRLRHSERGASATIVAVLFGGGVLLGASALSMDVGSIMWERRQLQNGADAATMALAQACGRDAAACVPGTLAAQAALTDANATDHAIAFDTSVYPNGVCGRGVAGLPECAAPSGTLLDCPALPPSIPGSVPFVQVYTSTETASGSGVLPPIVAQSFGYGGTTVKACARAAWGAPGPYATTVPMTFSVCEWEYNTGSGSDYYDAPVGATPGYGSTGQPAWPAAAKERTLFLQDHGTTTPCNYFSYHDVPGGFGYLEEDACHALVTTGGWVQVKTGASPPSGCDIAALRGHVVDIPMFDCTYRSVSGAPTMTPDQLRALGATCTEGTGNNTYYHVKGWAKFFVSGYRLTGGQTANSYVTGAAPCSGGDRCLSGWFVEGVLRDATSITGGSGTGFGSYVVLPAG
jgi:hypothetical protein